MGYRLLVVGARFPRQIAPGETFRLEHWWENRGVGRLWKHYDLKCYLVQSGKTAWSAEAEGFDPSRFTSGETYRWSSSFHLPASLAPGEYLLELALCDSKGRPAIHLAQAEARAGLRYVLGKVQVVPGARPAAVEGICFDFEKGVPQAFELAPGLARLAESKAKVIAGRWSLAGRAKAGEQVLFSTRPEVLHLSKGGIYEVSFRWRLLERPAGEVWNPGYCFFAATTKQGGKAFECGRDTWCDDAGAPAAQKTEFLVLGPYDDYRLVWGATAGGELALDDVVIRRLPAERCVYENFEAGPSAEFDQRFEVGQGAWFEEKSPLVGKRSLCGGFWWNYDEPDKYYLLLQTRPAGLPLKPLTSYTVSFLVRQEGGRTRGNYYFAEARSAKGGEAATVGAIRWMDYKNGRCKRKTFTFTTRDFDDYRLVIGIKNGGQCSLDELLIIENGPRAGAA